MTHFELEQKTQEMVNNLPIGYAFGNKQFEEMLSKWELKPTKEDLGKIVSLGNGAYALKTDLQHIKDVFAEIKQMKKDFRKDKQEFAKQVYHYFCDYECMVTKHPDYALDALEYEPTEDNKKIIREQWKKFCKNSSLVYFDPFTNPQFFSLWQT